MRFRTAFFALLVGAASPAAAGDKFWHTLATVGQIGIPVSAAGISLHEHDYSGLLALGETEALTIGSTQALKYAVDETRPNGGRHSFPSGHTSTAAAGAGYLLARYGWQVGVPFQLFTGLVAYSRVRTRDHFWYDVVAGAAIGEGSGFLLTTRRDGDVRVLPWGDSSGGGASLAMRF